MKNVLIVNQSAELYGADKAILELINNFPENYNPIVVLHEKGPLKQLLEKKVKAFDIRQADLSNAIQKSKNIR